MDVSAVIVSTNELNDLERCLPAVAEALEGLTHEVIIVDNACTDGTPDVVAESHPSVHLVKLDHRSGLCTARNAGAARSSGEFVLFLDSDATLTRGAVASLLGAMRAHPHVGIAGPRMSYPDGAFQESCRTFQTLSSFVRRGLGLGLGAADLQVLHRARTATEPFHVDWVMGACQMARRSAIEDVGPMDERFRLYYGDVEWCRRMWHGNWKVLYVPDARVTHAYRRKSASRLPNRWTLVHVGDFRRFRSIRARLPRRVAPRNRAVRILYLLDLLDGSGAAPRELANVVRGLDRERFEAVACATLVRAEGDERLARAIGLDLVCFEKRTRFDKYVTAPLRFARLLSHLRIDLVHSDLLKANLLAAFVGRLAGRRVVLSNRGSLDNSDVSRVVRLLYRLAFRFAHRTVVNAESLRVYNVEVLGAPAHRVVVVHDGVDAERLTPSGRLTRESLRIPEKRKVLATVARLERQKGHGVLLAALTRIPGPQRPTALLIGSGSLGREIQGKAERLGLADAVAMLGYREDVGDILSMADAFVLPSLYEGMPNSIMEAMAAGVPVIATAVDGTPELVKDGLTGLLVPPGDADALVQAITRTLTDTAGARTMADAAALMVKERFTSERMAKRMMEVYASVSASRAVAPVPAPVSPT